MCRYYLKSCQLWGLLGIVMRRDVQAIQQRITDLQLEHRDLDLAIGHLAQTEDYDELALKRLKKRKLQIKDSLVLLQMQVTPDIPA
jgi:hypothetical protein